MDDHMDEKQEQKFHQMTETPVSRLICRLAVPCIISMLVTSFYNMADTFFVGMLKSNSATGAVGVVFSLMATIRAGARSSRSPWPCSWAPPPPSCPTRRPTSG